MAPNLQLTQAQWLDACQSHQLWARRWTDPFRERRRLHRSHPVHDFLFVYYPYSPAKLEQWHPGAHVLLVDAEHQRRPGWNGADYRATDQGLILDLDRLQGKTRERMSWTRELLKRTASHRPNFSCLGLHEWAMVYGGHEIRHESTLTLRLPQSEIDQLVETRPLTCTHFDAFRFFAEDAQPLNRTPLTLLERPQQEQPACIHANMDLYKWAFKCMPWIGSQLLRDCFELAMAARLIDMRASPYDLQGFLDEPPIPIETPAGRAEYERQQRIIYENALPLRQRLIDAIEGLLAATTD